MSGAPEGGAPTRPSILVDARGERILSPAPARAAHAVPAPAHALSAAPAGALPDTTFSAGGVEIPRSSHQAFPFFEALAAKRQVLKGEKSGNSQTVYIVELRLRTGLAQGKGFALGVPLGCPGAELVRLLRQTADAIEAEVARGAPESDPQLAAHADSAPHADKPADPAG